MNYKIKNKGFTFVELLVIIFIIVVLASVILVTLSSSHAKSRDTKRKTDLSVIQQALEMYYSEKHKFPDVGKETCRNVAQLIGTDLDPKLRPYLSPIPSDPLEGSVPYCYHRSEDSYHYIMFAKLENTDDKDYGDKRPIEGYWKNKVNYNTYGDYSYYVSSD